MNTVVSALAATGPLAAGWSVHSLWMRRRLNSARRDPLTRLWTRDAFTARAQRLLRTPGATVVLVDLDRFKALNDTYGHAAGDAALVAVATRLSAWCAALRGVAGRLGGDEFTAITTPEHPADLPFDLHELAQLLAEPARFDGRELLLGASIGAFICDELPVPSLEQAWRRADEAMYAAKRSGGGWYIADGPQPASPTVNGRRAGRRGTTPPAR